MIEFIKFIKEISKNVYTNNVMFIRVVSTFAKKGTKTLKKS